MSITLAGYEFGGPHFSTEKLEDRSGVYAVLYKTPSGNYKVIDVGESHAVRTGVETHDRKSCWKRPCESSNLHYAVHYTPPTFRSRAARK